MIDKNLIDIFLDFEQDNKLFEIKIADIDLWHLIRFDLYSEIQKQLFSLGNAHTALSKENKLLRKIKRIRFLSDAIKNNPFSPKESDILILSHQRRVYNQGYYECLYTDLLIDNLELTYTTVEEPYLDKHLKPIKNPNIIYTDIYHLINEVKGHKIKRKYFHPNDMEIIKELLIKVNKDFDISINVETYSTKILKKLVKYKVLYPYFEKMISKINPKIIVEVVSYGFSRLIVNDIAKKKRIPIVELQHGTMGKYHVAYNYNEKQGLPSFPDYIFTFGQFWNENTRFPIEDHKVKSVGWPYFEHKVNSNKSDTSGNSRTTILFISQGTIGKELSQLAVQLFEKIDNSKYRIIYKLHPGEYDRWKSDYPWLIKSNLEVVDHNRNDMHYYFSESNIQIGVYSTALFEGLAYGLKTYIFELYGHEYMEELYNNDLASLVRDSADLVNSLEKTSKSYNDFDEEYFWMKNSLENLMNELNIIIEGRG